MNYNDVKPWCDKYGFKVTEKFGEIHIITKYEQWYFKETFGENTKIRLMHKDTDSRKKDSYHVQFKAYISAEDLVRYIKEHEDAKIKGNVDFTFDYHGNKL
jgi:hypothetical protein